MRQSLWEASTIVVQLVKKSSPTPAILEPEGSLLWDLRFSWRWLWRVLPAGCRVVWYKFIDVSEDSHCLHLHGWKVSRACKQKAFLSLLVLACQAYSRPWKWRRTFPWSVSKLLPDYTESHLRKQYSFFIVFKPLRLTSASHNLISSF
jgi:hypothetical protein